MGKDPLPLRGDPLPLINLLEYSLSTLWPRLYITPTIIDVKILLF